MEEEAGHCDEEGCVLVAIVGALLHGAFDAGFGGLLGEK